jgi:hypothetical protein
MLVTIIIIIIIITIIITLSFINSIKAENFIIIDFMLNFINFDSVFFPTMS